MNAIFEENKNFYPTPKKLIKKMIEGINWSYVKNILEPSAGNGNIVEQLLTHATVDDSWRSKRTLFTVDCIEIDEQLQLSLRDKGYRVVYNNFLTYTTLKHYDLIIMNPPFDNGCKHLLKALEMQKDGGAIVCLLNAETLRNAYSNERKDLVNRLKELNASIEYIENEFVDAERKTAVETAMIKVSIEEKESLIDDELMNKFKKNEQFKDIDFDDKTEQEQLLTVYSKENKRVELIVEQFEMETRMGIHVINEYNKIKPYILNKTPNKNKKYHYPVSLLMLSVVGDESNSGVSSCLKNNYIKQLRKKYWNTLFLDETMVGTLTQNMRTELYNKIDTYSEYDFSVFNIYTLLEEVRKNRVKGIEDTLITLFDELSGKYSYHEELNNKNIHYFNGWKTNKAWCVGEKVIVPYLRSDWQGTDRLSDIHKTLSHLNGDMSSLDINNEIRNKISEKSNGYYPNSYDYYTSDIELPYFNVHYYKKGTCHIKFTNKDLLDKFNIWACKHRNWIPKFYGKKAYNDMSKAEKDLVKEFSKTEENYNKIYDNQKDYLVEFSQQKMLGFEGV